MYFLTEVAEHQSGSLSNWKIYEHGNLSFMMFALIKIFLFVDRFMHLLMCYFDVSLFAPSFVHTEVQFIHFLICDFLPYLRPDRCFFLLSVSLYLFSSKLSLDISCIGAYSCCLFIHFISLLICSS